jgi:hypothetical protein
MKNSGDIFFAESDRPWILEGAAVRVSMIGFDDGAEQERTLDDTPVAVINANLSGAIDVTIARRLAENSGIAFMGTSKKGPSSFPKTTPTLEGWQINLYYQPAREVGGDFYDFHLLSEGRLGLVVGDATGKGVPAALVMSTTCGMLQLAAQASDSSSPGEVLSRVNEALTVRIPQNMFVTCFYGVLEPSSGRLVYANADHNLPCCCHD